MSNQPVKRQRPTRERTVFRSDGSPATGPTEYYPLVTTDAAFTTLETRCAELEAEKRRWRHCTWRYRRAFRAAMKDSIETIERLRGLLCKAARRIPKMRNAGIRGREKDPLRLQIDAALTKEES